jgi:HSP20 family protein
MPTYRPGFAFPLEELRDELDRFWNTLTAAPARHGWGVRPGDGVFPAVNVRESDEAVTIEAEVPGLDTADVDVTVAGDELLLKGSRTDACPTQAGTADASPGNGEPGSQKDRVTWHRRERGTGAFERRIKLPVAVDASRVEARLVDGVLTITCPKAAECQPRKVAVRSA